MDLSGFSLTVSVKDPAVCASFWLVIWMYAFSSLIRCRPLRVLLSFFIALVWGRLCWRSGACHVYFAEWIDMVDRWVIEG